MKSAWHRHQTRILLGILGVFLLLGTIGFFTKTLSRLETLTLDHRYVNWQRERAPSDEIVIIDIDDESLKFFEPEYGAWPWPRSVHKKVLEYLSMSQPKAVLFDVLFTEKQREEGNDQQLAESSKSFPGISHALKFIPEAVTEGVKFAPMPPQVEKQQLRSVKNLTTFPFTYDFHDFHAPNETLLQVDPEIHVVNAIKDSDGLFRRGHSIFQYQGLWYPSLALKGLMSLLANPSFQIHPGRIEIWDGNQRKWKLPIDEQGQAAFHFYPAKKTFKTYQIGQILKQKDQIDKGLVEDPSTLDPNPLEAFADKIVIVGASAVGLEDLKATPIHISWPGVLLHATTVSNVLQQEFLRPLPSWSGWALAFILAALVYCTIFIIQSLLLRSLLPPVALFAYAGFALWMFRFDWHIPLAIPLLGGGLSLLDAFIYMTFVEGQQKKKAMSTLSKFLPPEVAQDLLARGIDPTAEVGRRRNLSILFSDIRGFTTLSESKPAEEIVSILNTYLGRMTDLIFTNKGTLDKFIGDAVMCFWNAPSELEKHPRWAVLTAMQMTEELKKLNENFVKQGIEPLAIGIGVHTGEAIVGNIGSEKRLDYTIIGDNVNLASRLEGLTKQYGVEIVIGPETFERVKDVILCRPVDHVIVKGKTEPVKIYEPICLRSAVTPEAQSLADEFGRAHALYIQGQFSEAKTQFEAILKTRQDKLTKVYLERLEDLLENPPATWDGTYTAKSK